MFDFFTHLLAPTISFLATIQEAITKGWVDHIDIVFYVGITLGAIFTYLFSRPKSSLTDNFFEAIGMGYCFAALVMLMLFLVSMIFGLAIIAIVAMPFLLYAALVFGICVVIGKFYKRIHKSVHKSIDSIFPEL